MHVKGWRRLFNPECLIESLDYIANDDVVIECKDDDHIHAKVYGRREHLVDIYVDGVAISTMHCDCSYSRKWGYCSHLAAVLSEMECTDSSNHIDVDEFEYPDCWKYWMEDDVCSDEDEERLLEIIEEMSEAQLKSALYHIARKSGRIRENLITRYASKVDSLIALNVETMIDSADEDFVDESCDSMIRDEKGYVGSVMEILNRYLPRFIRAKLLKEAFDISESALRIVGWHYLSDDKAKKKFGNVVTGYWNMLYSCGDDSLRKYMQVKVAEIEADDSNDVFVIDVAFDFRNSASDDDYYVCGMLEERKSYIEYDGESYEAEWYLDHMYERSASFVFDNLFRKSVSKDEIDSFVRTHFSSRRVVEKALEYYRGNGSVREELDLLLLVLASDNLNMSECEIFSDAEIIEFESRAYKLLESGEDYHRLADFLIQEVTEKHRYGLVRNIKELKNHLTSVERKGFSEVIYGELGKGDTYIGARILIFNIMCDIEESVDIFRVLESCSLDLEFVSAIIKKLVVMDSERAYLIHSKALGKFMKKNRSRKTFRDIVSILKEMESMYPDGRILAESLANEWKDRYPDRKNMKEELLKAGY